MLFGVQKGFGEISLIIVKGILIPVCHQKLKMTCSTLDFDIEFFIDDEQDDLHGIIRK